MGDIFSVLLKPFAWMLLFFYQTFQSYGIALIVFAFIIKMILFPVTLKSKKSMIQTTMLSGRMQQLQKQYGKDKERYNLEVQKLYEREGVNPMGGCIWSLIPMILIIAVYGIIRQPMTNFMSLSTEQIQMIAQHLDWQNVAVANGWTSQAAMDKLVQQVADGKIASVFQTNGFNEIYLISLINEANLPSIQALVGSSKMFIMDFSFLGLDLSLIPKWNFWTTGFSWNSIGLFLLPLVSTVVSFLSMKVSMSTNQMNKNKQQEGNNAADQTTKMMMWTMPLLSLWIGFTLPAALCIYWIAQYVVTMLQEIICSKMLEKDYEKARIAAEERELREKEEEKQRKEEARLEKARRAEEEKKNKAKKKAAKKDENAESINKDDSREGIRAYARGRSYIPDRFGGVTPYRDPNTKTKQPEDAAQPEEPEETAPVLSEPETVELPVETDSITAPEVVPEEEAPEKQSTEEEEK